MADHESRPGLTDDEARAIATRMVREAGQAPDADHAGEDNVTPLDEPRGGESAADEARIQRALVDEGFVPPDMIDDPPRGAAAGERA